MNQTQKVPRSQDLGMPTMSTSPEPQVRYDYARARIKPCVQVPGDISSQQWSKETCVLLDNGSGLSFMLEDKVTALRLWDYVQRHNKHPRMNHWWILLLHKIRSRSRRVRHSASESEKYFNKQKWNERSQWRLVHGFVARTLSFMENIEDDPLLGNDTNGDIFRRGVLELWLKVEEPGVPNPDWRRIDVFVIRGKKTLDCDWVLGKESELFEVRLKRL